MIDASLIDMSTPLALIDHIFRVIEGSHNSQKNDPCFKEIALLLVATVDTHSPLP